MKYLQRSRRLMQDAIESTANLLGLCCLEDRSTLDPGGSTKRARRDVRSGKTAWTFSAAQFPLDTVITGRCQGSCKKIPIGNPGGQP